jgi:predicted nuclease of predicted toxin-antitoxin system
MLLLADENFPRATVEALLDDGHDLVWVRKTTPGAKDHALLELAEREQRLILTLDKDFWQIAVQRPEPMQRCGVMLFRIHPAVAEKLTPLARRAIASIGERWRGHICIVTMTSINLLLARKPG